MSELITDEMAHDAAKAAYEADPLFRSIFGKMLNPPEPLPWDELPLEDILRRRKDARAALDAAAPLIAKRALRVARSVITQYLATAEKWRYDRVVWAFAIMLGEIPEDTPCPDSPADERERARRIARPTTIPEETPDA